MIFTTEIGKLALSSAFLSGQFLYGHRCICTVRGCLRSPSIARAPGKAWTGSLLKLMSPFFLLSQLCFVQPWHNLNLKQLQFTWYYNIQGKNPSDRWFAQFHPLWKHKCYKSRKEESCFGMLRNTVSVNATCCMWIKPIEFVNMELPTITQERDLGIITQFSESIRLNAQGWYKGKTVSRMITKGTANTVSLHINWSFAHIFSSTHSSKTDLDELGKDMKRKI